MTLRALHTPGPWELSSDGVWGVSPWNARVRLATITFFADMNGIDTHANARLIAAAPEMYGVLQAIVQAELDSTDLLDALCDARAVLKKARGEQ